MVESHRAFGFIIELSLNNNFYHHGYKSVFCSFFRLADLQERRMVVDEGFNASCHKNFKSLVSLKLRLLGAQLLGGQLWKIDLHLVFRLGLHFGSNLMAWPRHVMKGHRKG